MNDQTRTVEVVAPAKVNVFLRVLGRRDDGYHEVRSLLVPISLADRLQVTAGPGGDGLRLSLEVTGDPELVDALGERGSNLALTAARALADRTGTRAAFAEIRLEKRIPVAAGLGGGSSDAAATLRVLNELWRTDLTDRALGEVAAGVGSDVPALLANRAVEVTGRGEHVRVAAKAPTLELALVGFDTGIRTADAYAWWDEDGGPQAEAEPVLDGVTVANDLQGPVLHRHPRIGRARDLLREAQGIAAALLCGSGPTLAGFLRPGRHQLDPPVEEALEALSGRPVRYAVTLPDGA